MWAEQDVHTYTKGIRPFLPPAIGEIALVHESLDLPGDDGLSITVYNADPDTPAAAALKLLASWTATQEQEAATASAKPEL
ncbi:hypothetical protein [Streptomyces sp. NPDC059262]|uniref:MmyB family transcriptional regulator n=1 Tax=Streptomyces sp. NPDC059262 TaxID=3346797 RepID=UPI003676AA00